MGALAEGAEEAVALVLFFEEEGEMLGAENLLPVEYEVSAELSEHHHLECCELL